MAETAVMKKPKILITDDSRFNQEMIAEILGDKYDYIYSNDGIETIELLNANPKIDLIFLDINMPVMSGIKVLEIMNERHWIEEIPVIVISAEEDSDFIDKSYSLGATDYITKPLNRHVVQRRTENTLKLYARQHELVRLVGKQVYDRERTNNTIITILGQVIETKSHETGGHILSIRKITNMLLHELVNITDEYNLSEAEISLITTLSTLHDIGKMSIPDEILNKPGKLTDEEFEIMKNHTVLGDALLDSVLTDSDDHLMSVAHAICRWHHERWDGKGYPDGLSKDSIPISAQIVSVADVYDALTSERCYKKPYTHEQAIKMILNGECGQFNPKIIQCLKNIERDLQEFSASGEHSIDYRSEASILATETFENEDLHVLDRYNSLFRNESAKAEFFSKMCDGIKFVYDRYTGKISYFDACENGKPLKTEVLLGKNKYIKFFKKEDWESVVEQINKTTPDNSDFSTNVLVNIGGEYRWHRLNAKTIWKNEKSKHYSLAIGQLVDIHESIMKKNVKKIFGENQSIESIFKAFHDVFSVVRLVNPKTSIVYEMTEDGSLVETPVHCYEIWGRETSCDNCSSGKALENKNWSGKLEVMHGKIYTVLSKYVRVAGQDCILEIAFCINEHANEKPDTPCSDTPNLYLMNFYRDALTMAYSRMYLEDFMPNFENADGIAILDIDNFKAINDTYGHQFGDIALRFISETINECMGEGGILIRYGGDEFLIIFPKISEDGFYNKINEIKETISNSVLESCKELRFEVSIGGVYKVKPLMDAIAKADQAMYEEKKQKTER